MIFPRDVELKVIKHFDIDTRLAHGIKPCKLIIPQKIINILENIKVPQRGSVNLSNCVITWYPSFGLKRLIWMNSERIVTHSVQSKDLEKYTWYIF